MKMLHTVVCLGCLLAGGLAGAQDFLHPDQHALLDARSLHGLVSPLRLWRADAALAARYESLDDREERLFRDCRHWATRSPQPADITPALAAVQEDRQRTVPNGQRETPINTARCASLALTLFRSGASVVTDSGDILIASFGTGPEPWRHFSATLEQSLGGDLALALVLAHEIGHLVLIKERATFPDWLGAAHCQTDCHHRAPMAHEVSEAFCDLLAIWLVSTHYQHSPQLLLAALVAARQTLGQEWQRFARTLAARQVAPFAASTYAQALELAHIQALLFERR